MNKIYNLGKTISNSYLATLEKKYFKPGGRKATKFIFEAVDKYCKQNNDVRILEVWCEQGLTSIRIAKKHHCKIVAIDPNKEVLTKARINAIKRDVNDKIEFINADILEIDFSGLEFDIIICEVMLSLSDDKNVLLQHFYNLLSDRGILLTHDMCFKNKTIDIQQKPEQNFITPYPLPIQSWKDTFQNNNFYVHDYLVGKFKLFSFVSIILNEGFINALKLINNLYKKEKKDLSRIFKFIKRNRSNLGFISMISSKYNDNNIEFTQQ